MSKFDGVLGNASEITWNNPDDPTQGFLQLTLSTGEKVRGRIDGVYDGLASLVDRPYADYTLHVDVTQIVAFEYDDPTGHEAVQLGIR